MTEQFYESNYKSELTPYRIECARKMTGKILDVGGGIGCYLPFFTGEATVIDISEEALEHLDYDKKIVADAMNLPFEDNYFDSIWCCAVAQYFGKDGFDKFLNEAKRVGKNNAKIMILVPNRKSVWEPFKHMLGISTWSQQKFAKHQFNVKELKAYGKVKGEIRFLPFESIFRNIPFLGNTLMLEIIIKK